ncbi:MAG: methyltransferase family protein [Bacteroidota bacterium]
MLLISRRSIVDVRSHGFYRFFAWEAILLLILINIPHWFTDPFSVRQIFSWILLLLSLPLLWQGVSLLRKARNEGLRTDKELYAFEQTTELVTGGIYRYIRHPLYSSLLFLACGAFLKNISWTTGLLTLAAFLFLTATAAADEKECIRYFGPQYADYMSRTKKFIPYIY